MWHVACLPKHTWTWSWNVCYFRIPVNSSQSRSGWWNWLQGLLCISLNGDYLLRRRYCGDADQVYLPEIYVKFSWQKTYHVLNLKLKVFYLDITLHRNLQSSYLSASWCGLNNVTCYTHVIHFYHNLTQYNSTCILSIVQITRPITWITSLSSFWARD